MGKRTKQLLSFLTAAAMSVSAFAGLMTGVSAEEYTAAKFENVTLPDDTAKLMIVEATKTAQGVLESIKFLNYDAEAYDEGTYLITDANPNAEYYLWDDKITPLSTVGEIVDLPTPAPKVYIDEPFEYEDGLVIASVGVNDPSATPPPSVQKGDIVYSGGLRNNGPMSCSASISNETFVVSSDGYGDQRGISFKFADTVGVPEMSKVPKGQVLEMSFDVISANNGFEVTGFGDITKDDLAGGDNVNVRIILDKAANRQSVIVTDADGKVVNSRFAALTATGFTGIAFNKGTASITIDNLKVETKGPDTGVVNVMVADTSANAAEDAVLAGATVEVSKATFTTGDDGKVAIVLPNGTYDITASKPGHEHTAQRGDNHTESVTVETNTQDLNLSLMLMVYIKNPHEEETVIEDGQVFVAAPKSETPATTAPFTVDVVDQYGIPMTEDEYSLDWAIYPAGTEEADSAVTISEDGVVSVSQAFSAGEDQVKPYDVVAIVTANNEGLRSIKLAKTLYVGNMDIIYYEPLNWETNDRDTAKKLASEVELTSDITAVHLTLSFSGLGNRDTAFRNIAVMSGDKDKNNTTPIVAIQTRKEDKKNQIIAWTGYTKGTEWNQEGDRGAYTNSEVLIEDYTADKEFTVSFAINKAEDTVTVSCGDVTKNLPYPSTVDDSKIVGLHTGMFREQPSTKVKSITIQEPDSNYLAISGDADFAKISGRPITKTYALAQSVIVSGEEFEWGIEGTHTGIEIEDGVLTVTDEAVAGTYTITAVSAINPDKNASLAVEIGDFQTFDNKHVEISGPRAYEFGVDTTGAYEITKAVDSYGDDVAKLLPAAAWASSDTSVATIDSATGELTVVGKGTTNITATIDNGGAVSTLTVPVTVADYSLTETTNVAKGASIDISSLIKTDEITGYLVTVADANKNKLAQATVQASGTNVTVPEYDGTATSVEVSPVFTYKVGTPGHRWTLGAGYEIAIPAGSYNFEITANGDRSDVYANDQMIVNNILQGGSAVKTFAVNDIVVNEGVAKITSEDYATGKDYTSVNVDVKVVKAPSNVERVKKVYVLGDSLVCIYYNGAKGPDSNWQTGWGQVLDRYLTDDVEIINLANSGATANGLYGTAFTQVRTSAKAGDIVLIEAGYNDRTYDPPEVMDAAVDGMVNVVKGIGATPILISPNASAHDYKAGVSWTSRMADAATRTGADYIDLAAASFKFLSEVCGYGTNYGTYQSYYNVSDDLHSTYNGAQCWAAIVAEWLNTNGYSEIVNANSQPYTFNDGSNDITVGVGQAKTQAALAK